MSKEVKDNYDETIEDSQGAEEKDVNEEGKDENKESGNDNKDDKDANSKSFTQSQVNKMMTREKNQGRSSAYRELGIDPKDSKMVQMVKSFIESQKTDEQKANEKELETQTKMNEAEQRAQIAEAKAEAMMLGVKAQYVDDLVTLALSRMSEESDLKTIIGEFKTKYPVWFGEDNRDDKDDKGSKEKETKEKTGQKGTGSSVKSSKEKEDKDNKGLGARLAAQRKVGTKKASYWGNNK